MENTQNERTVSTKNYLAEELVFKLNRLQAHQFLWMAMLGIQASKWYIDCINNCNKGEIYWEDVAQTQCNIQDVNVVIDEMIKVVDLPFGITTEENYLVSDLKRLGILVSIECKNIEENS